jgi:hypothetical protein
LKIIRSGNHRICVHLSKMPTQKMKRIALNKKE